MSEELRGPISATDLIAERNRRLRDDPHYRAQIEKRDAERAERTRRAREAEQPILQELAGIGVSVDSVWELRKDPDAAARAVPVLLSHLDHDYPGSVIDGISSSMSGQSARAHWTAIRALYTRTDNAHVRDRLAAVMSGCAIRVHYQDLLSFVGDESLGESRIYFLRPINRIGNRISPGAGRSIVNSLATDPMMGKEARAILAGRGPNE
ncbi:hypothetical protein ABIB25_000646 [Nakamurella sp. UYEF19]|uniref:hypothetical protein n=1 Tax=Nakamurella sp. UYEF19 TaxID=1756392 RepID=UPI00339938B2